MLVRRVKAGGARKSDWHHIVVLGGLACWSLMNVLVGIRPAYLSCHVSSTSSLTAHYSEMQQLACRLPDQTCAWCMWQCVLRAQLECCASATARAPLCQETRRKLSPMPLQSWKACRSTCRSWHPWLHLKTWITACPMR